MGKRKVPDKKHKKAIQQQKEKLRAKLKQVRNLKDADINDTSPDLAPMPQLTAKETKPKTQVLSHDVISKEELLNLLPQSTLENRLQPFNLTKKQQQRIIEIINTTNYTDKINTLKKLQKILSDWSKQPSTIIDAKVKTQSDFIIKKIQKELNHYIQKIETFKEALKQSSIEHSTTHWRILKKAHDALKKHHEYMKMDGAEFIRDVISEIISSDSGFKQKSLMLIDNYFKLKLYNPNEPTYIKLKYQLNNDYKDSFNTTISEIDSAITQLEEARYTGDDEWKIIKKISEGYYEKPQIEEISLGIIGELMVAHIIENISDAYDTIDNEHKNKLLFLIKCLLKSDKLYQNLITNSSKTKIRNLLGNLQEKATQQNETDFIYEMLEIFQTKCHERELNYQDFLEKIQKGQLSSDQLERRINRLTDQTKQKLIFPESFVAQLYDILTIAHTGYFKQNINSTFINSLKTANNFVPGAVQSYLSTIKTIRIYELNRDKITISTPKKLSFNKEAVAEQEELSNNLEKIAKGTHKDPNAYAAWFSAKIENYFKFKFINCKISEFRNAPWIKDKENALNNIKTEQYAPTINHLHQFGKMLTLLIANSILFQKDENHEHHIRANRSEMENMVKFIQIMMIYAINNGATHTLYYCRKALELKAIHTLELLGTPEFSKTFATLKKTNIRKLSIINPMPHLPFLLKSLQEKYSDNNNLNKILIGGALLNKIKAQQQALRKENISADSHLFEIFKILTLNESNTYFISTTDEIQLNMPFAEKKLNEILPYIFIPIEKLPEYSIKELETIMLKCAENKLPLPVRISPNSSEFVEGKNATINYLRDSIETESSLPSLNQVLTILNNLELILKNTNIEYTGHYIDKVKIFNAFSERLHVLSVPPIKKDNMNQIKLFFEDYNVLSGSFESLKDKQNISEILSGEKKALIDLFNYFEELNISLKALDTYQAKSTVSEAYLKNLSALLENEQGQDLVLPGGKIENDSKPTEPDTGNIIDIEYETHPEYIGYAESLNTFTEIGEKIESDAPPFSNQRIIELFTNAFPWAIMHPKDLESTPLQSNLLNTDTPIDPILQKEIMDLVFCSLDALGKLAGPKGELALKNLDAIDNIVSTLNDLSDTIKHPEPLKDQEQLKAIKESIAFKTTIISQNNDTMYKKLIHKIPLNPEEKISTNTGLNEFLHINEKEAHRHLQALLQEQTLIPQDFFSAYVTPPAGF